MARPFDIVGYTYRADNYCAACILTRLDGQAPADDVEAKLDYLAPYYGVADREDERSFDSDDFPKVIFRDQVEPGERCGNCGRLLDD